MKLRRISEEIEKRSLRRGFLFSSFSIIFTLLIFLFYSYDIYFGRTQKLAYGYIFEITNALINGDILFARRLLSSINKSRYFTSLFIEDTRKRKIIILNGEKNFFLDRVNISSKYSYSFINGELFFLTSLSLDGKPSSQSMVLVCVQKINYILIIFVFILLFSFWLVVYYFVKDQSKKYYNKLFVPVMNLSENIGTIATNKEVYYKFVNYIELDLIYKNFNKVYMDLERAQKELKKIETMKAISNTIQMLAHDIRHPFAHIKNSLQVMLKLKSYDQIMEYIKNTGQTIEKDILRIENMLSDLLQFQTEGKPNIVEASFYKLIYSVIKNCFEIQSKSNIFLKYSFSHRYKLKVDIQKIERVLSNILMNAIEAMGGKGEIFFSSNEFLINNVRIFEICIGNTNSYIDFEVGNKIFDLFYTNGKVRGTGLGLGIAKEIIQQHGGKLFYTSSADQGVKFYIHFSNSFSDNLDDINGYEFPSEASYFEKNFNKNYNSTQMEYENRCKLLEMEIFKNLEIRNLIRKYQILILEDEETYVNNLLSIIHSEVINKYFNFIICKNYEDALNSYYAMNPEFIICDIDLGLENLNGFDFVKKLRKIGCISKICIHTNRFFKCDLENSISVGSDFFIVKPMSRYQFLKFLCSYILPDFRNELLITNRKLSLNYEKKIVEEIVINNPTKNSSKIVVIDDEQNYLDFWKMIVTDSEVITFQHPDLVVNYFFDNPDALNKVECIIVDYYFDNIGQNICQMKFVNVMREIQFEKPIFVSTNAILNSDEVSIFDGVLNKEPYSLSKLKNLFCEKF